MMKRTFVRRALALLFAFALAAAFGWTAAQLMDRAAFDAESAADRAALHDQIAAIETANAALAEQVRELGGEPVAEADGADMPHLIPIPGPAGRTGDDGPAGRNGRDGTSPDPVPGPPGRDGADGESITGPAGPKGDTGPPGKDGSNGKDGTNGSDGRGIVSIDCNPDADWVVTYTDGTTQTITGPCRLIPEGTLPDPAP